MTRPALTRRAALVGALAAPAIRPARAQPADKALTVTWGEDDIGARTYDPRVTSSRHENQVIGQVFDSLLSSDETNKLFPGLATAWDQAADGRSITLKLRTDVGFHDGTPFDADAVKFTFDSIADPKTGSESAVDLLGPYAGTDVLDPHTVRVNFRAPFGAALANFSEMDLAPVSPTAVRKLGDGFARAPVGAGPFRFVSWADRQQVVLERFDKYDWAPPFMKRKGPANVARVVHRFIPDASTRIAALESGEIDIADATPVLDMKRLGDARGFKTMEGNTAGIPFGVELNGSRGIFADVAVRRALALAVDRAALCDDLFFGIVPPAYGALSSSTPGYWPGCEGVYKTDVKAAAALLDGAGWKPGPDGIRVKNGQRLHAFYGAPPPLEPDTAVYLQSVLKRVGFELEVQTITFAHNQELVFANNYDMLPVRWASADPSCLESLFAARNIASPGRYKYNWGHLNDPELDKMFADGVAETDQNKRAAIYQQAQQRIMDTALWFPVHNQVSAVAYRATRGGYRFARADWCVLFYDVGAA